MSATNRHNSRVLILQKLFNQSFLIEHDFGNNLEQLSEDDALQILEISQQDIDNEFIYQILNQIPANQDEINKLIQKYATELPFNKIARVDLLILTIAILEGFILKITPSKVAINESIELSKEFCNDQSRKFISGVMGAIFDQYETNHDNQSGRTS